MKSRRLGDFQTQIVLMPRDKLDDRKQVAQSVRYLGQGSLGSTYKGELSINNDIIDVVFKSRDKLSEMDAWEAILADEEAFKRVSPHENIIKCFGSRRDKQHPDIYYMVMEYMPLSLRESLEGEKKPNTYKELLEILQGIARGLVHLHSKSIYHHALKPENILLSRNMVPKLADFGASRIKLWQTKCPPSRQTLGYKSPEELLDSWMPKHKEINIADNQSSDIFSFGVLMWECTTGICSGEPNDKDETVEWGGVIPMKVKCNCPEELRNLIEKCLRFDAAAMCNKEFGRPTSLEILKEVTNILQTCKWVEDPIVWQKKQKHKHTSVS